MPKKKKKKGGRRDKATPIVSYNRLNLDISGSLGKSRRSLRSEMISYIPRAGAYGIPRASADVIDILKHQGRENNRALGLLRHRTCVLPSYLLTSFIVTADMLIRRNICRQYFVATYVLPTSLYYITSHATRDSKLAARYHAACMHTSCANISTRAWGLG